MKYLLLVISVLFFGGCSYKSEVAKYQKELNQPLPYYVKSFVTKAKQELPIVSDDKAMTIYDVDYKEDHIYFKCSTIYNLEENSSFDEAFNEGFENGVDKSFCKEPRFRVLINKGMVIVSEIKGNDGGIITVVTNNSKCNKLGYLVEKPH